MERRLNKTMKHILPVLSLMILLTPVQGCAGELERARDDSHSASAQPSAPVEPSPRAKPISAQEVMNKVAERYSSLRHYSSRGTNIHKSNFDGKEDAPEQTDFEIKYDRGKSGSIEWTDRGTQKKFSFDGKTSTESANGRVTHSYATPLSGLMTVELAEGGWTLFQINLFVFRDELKLGDKAFFLTIEDPIVSDECEVDGRPCYLLSGKLRRVDGGMSYWIDKTDYVIRKIERVINRKKETPEKTWVRTTTTTEEYRDIEIK